MKVLLVVALFKLLCIYSLFKQQEVYDLNELLRIHLYEKHRYEITVATLYWNMVKESSSWGF